MSLMLSSRADLTLDALRRVAFAGESAEWMGDSRAIDPAPDITAEASRSRHLRPLPGHVSRAVAFARLAHGGSDETRVNATRLTERDLTASAADDEFATSAALAGVVAIIDGCRLEFAERVLALSIEAYRAPLDPYHPALAELWGDPYQSAALRGLNELLEGGEPTRQRHQGPVSYRIVPRLTGQARRALAQLEEIAGIALRGPARPGTATGLSHDAPIAAAVDAMSATWADIGALAHRHVVRLARARGTGGPQPVPAPTDAVDEMRRLAQPAVLGALEVSADPNEDVPPLAPTAYLSHRRVAARLDEVVTVLAAAGAEAPAIGQFGVSPALSALMEAIRQHAPAPPAPWSPNVLGSLADAVSDSIDQGRALGT
jgi:histidine ammonia-lyase